MVDRIWSSTYIYAINGKKDLATTAFKQFFKDNIKGKYKSTSFHDSGYYGPIPGGPIQNTKENIERWIEKNIIL